MLAWLPMPFMNMTMFIVRGRLGDKENYLVGSYQAYRKRLYEFKKETEQKVQRHVNKDILTINNLGIIITQDRPVFVLKICQTI